MTGDSPATRCAVLGKPIGHSLSPVLHRTAYAGLGLDWSYDAVEMDQAGLPGFLAGLDASWRGLSLTMPLKRAVLPLLDTVLPMAARAGAANTVLLSNGVRIGDNTDVPGAVAAVRERYQGPLESAVVIGGGATAGSMLLALADLGCRRVTLLVRDEARARGAVEIAARNGSPVVTTAALEGEPLSADIVISTVPTPAQTPALVRRVAQVSVVFEVVYEPWPTPLARSVGSERTLIGGLDLLVQQAVRQLALMLDLTPDRLAEQVPAMRAAGQRALAAR